MRKQLLARALILALAGIVQLSCSGSAPTKPPLSAPTGTVVIFGGDAPLCSIISFSVTISGLSLTPKSSSVTGGTTPVSILPSGQPVTVDFASLMDFKTLLSLSSKVPAGTYSQLTITISSAQITYLDASKTPPAPTTFIPTITPLTVTLDLNPILSVSGNGTVGLQLDFNLLKSVLTDITTGQITGSVNPTFTAAATSASSTGSLADFEEMRGLVQSVQTTSTNTSFVGSFSLQPAGGAALNISVNSATTFSGVTGLSGLTANTFVEVDAFADANGNVVAKAVEAEAQEDSTKGQAAFVGLITSVTRDTSGNATQFTVFVREEDPDVSTTVPLQTTFTVDVNSTTQFAITSLSQASNFANFSFGPTTLATGQKIVVHAQLPAAGTTPSVATGRSVFLEPQSILGNLDTSPTTPVVRGTDGKTGGFTLVPCSPIFQSQPITVLTSLNTTFAGTGVTDLTSLTSSTPLLLVKGLLFYQQQVGTVNSVTWVPPANVQVATQVHQLP